MAAEGADNLRSKPAKLGRRVAKDSGPGAEEIASIALDLFAERHYSLVTIRDIGRAAGVNSAMIYYHFKDKNELFRAAISNAVREAFALFSQHQEMGSYLDIKDALHSWFQIHMLLHGKLRNVIKIGIDSKCLENDVPDIMEPIRYFYVEERRILGDIFAEHTETRNLSEARRALLSTVISTSLDGILTRSMLLEDFDMKEAADEFRRMIISTLKEDTEKSLSGRE